MNYRRGKNLLVFSLSVWLLSATTAYGGEDQFFGINELPQSIEKLIVKQGTSECGPSSLINTLLVSNPSGARATVEAIRKTFGGKTLQDSLGEIVKQLGDLPSEQHGKDKNRFRENIGFFAGDFRAFTQDVLRLTGLALGKWRAEYLPRAEGEKAGQLLPRVYAQVRESLQAKVYPIVMMGYYLKAQMFDFHAERMNGHFVVILGVTPIHQEDLSFQMTYLDPLDKKVYRARVFEDIHSSFDGYIEDVGVKGKRVKVPLQASYKGHDYQVDSPFLKIEGGNLDKISIDYVLFEYLLGEY